jgi:putative nucleotidyltransferase with HDIG domain
MKMATDPQSTAMDQTTPTSTTADANTWLFVVVVAVAGALALMRAAAITLTAPLNGYVIVLGALTIVAGRFCIKIPGRSATVSFSDVFVFTSLVLVGPAPATLTVAIDGLWVSVRQRDPRAHRTLFNVAEPALSTWAAGQVFFLVVSHVSTLRGTPDLMGRVAGTIAMAATYFLLNSVLTASAVAIESRQSVSEIWRQNAAYLAVNDYAAASLATLLVRNGSGIDLEVVSLVAPLLLLSYAAYKSAATRVEEAHQHVHEVEHLYSATIETLAIAVDAKDQVTHGHIRRVQRHTVMLADRLGMTDGTELKALRAASLLHDVGKLAVPDYVLNKPGRLTGSEFDRIKQHANTGASILTTVEFPYPVVPIVRHHHEQWSGRGYPDGLAGDAIPIGARILAVVDCFDALTSDRPYRRKMTDVQATAILLEQRGIMYDARVVDAFIELLPELRRGDMDVQQRFQEGASGVPPLPSPDRIAVADDDRVTTHALRRAGRSAAVDVARLIPQGECCVFVPAMSCEWLVPAYATPALGEVLAAEPVRIGEGLSGWVAATRHTIVNSHADLDLGDAAQRLGLTSCTSTPVFALGDLAAVFTVYARRPLSAAESSTIGRLGQEIGLNVARAREASVDLSERAAAVSVA